MTDVFPRLSAAQVTDKVLRPVTLILILLLTASRLSAQTVEVTVTGIRSEKGQIAIGVFIDEESFRQEEAFLEPRFSKENLTDGIVTFNLTLEPGVYGLSVLDDENSDGQMEYRMLGLPKEGFGFSGYYHTGITRPKFDDFRFTVVQGQEMKITVRMKYF